MLDTIFSITVPEFLALLLILLQGTIVDRTYGIHKNLYI